MLQIRSPYPWISTVRANSYHTGIISPYCCMVYHARRQTAICAYFLTTRYMYCPQYMRTPERGPAPDQPQDLPVG